MSEVAPRTAAEATRTEDGAIQPDAGAARSGVTVTPSVASAAVGPRDIPAIEVRGLRMAYGDREVLAGVDLRVWDGQIVALLGPNGAGKTTTVEVIEGYRRAAGGTVRVLGMDPTTGGPALRARVGLMLQGGGLDPRMTPRDALRLYAALHVGGRDPGALLAQVGLDAVARTRIRRLSGGERQRLALAIALVGDPEVLVLDEPTAGMDPEARRSTRDLVASLRDAGRAILLTTHDLGDVERLADRVAILKDGRIVAEDSPSALAAGARPVLRCRFARALAPVDRAALGAALAGTLVEDGGPGSYRLADRTPDPATIAALAAWCATQGVQIVELRAGGATLEERYLELTGDVDVEAVA